MKQFFKGFKEGMKCFGKMISNAINFILLIPAYFIGIGLVSIIGKLFGKHWMNTKNTHWKEQPTKKESIERYCQQW